MPEISKRLLKDLQWLASHQGHSLTMLPQDARKLLMALGEDWCPEVKKETTKEGSIKSLERGLVEKYGRKNVRFAFGLDDRSVENYVWDLVHISVRTAGWPDETVKLLAKASGFSRHFEESGSGAGGNWRDINYVSRRGRKAA